MSAGKEIEYVGNTPDRWTLIRDLLVFQGKLFLDGLRDLILSPVSLVLGAIDLITGGPQGGHRFYRLLHFGRRTDKWINLFGNADRVFKSPKTTYTRDSGLDDIVDQLEDLVRRQHEKGGVTAAAKDTIDEAIDRWQAGLRTRH